MKKVLFILLILTIILSVGCQNEAKQITSIDDLRNARIASWPSSNCDMIVKKFFPNAENVYLDSIGDMVENLKQDKIDAFIINKVYVENLKSEGIAVGYLDESLEKVQIAYAFTKNESGKKLCNQMNEFLKKLNEDGTLEKLKQKWTQGDESSRTFTKSALTGENGKLKVASEALTMPYSYIKNGEVNGYEVELLDKFCAEYGYDYEINIDSFSSLLSSTTLGKIDIGMSSIEITEERAQNVLFSEPTDIDDIVAVVNLKNEAKKKTIDDLKHARIGIWADSGYEVFTNEVLPEAEYLYFDYISDLIQNLKQGKIDAFAIGRIDVKHFQKEGMDIDFIDKNIGIIETAYVFPKSEQGEKLRGQMNEFIKKITSDGTLDNLKKKWFDSDESERVLMKSELTGENGTLTIATEAVDAPYIYIKDGEVTGYEVEILDKFCAAYGYNYDVKVENFDAMLNDISLSKADIGASNIEPLPEREERLLFSDATNFDETVFVINKDSVVNENFFDAISDRIKSTLIIENRWQMILNGVKITLIITILAIIFGSLLGFAIFMIYRERNKFANILIDRVINILQGLPQMVMLMFFYYVIFGSVDVDGTIVAVIVFSIILSVSVFIMLKSGEQSISKGQMEAALALGFTERNSFLKFVLPQIIKNYFPTYQKIIIELLLSTAVVGYIAVQDLTRMGDLIRARTFDAFVPLIVVSLIYFVLSWLLLNLTNRILSKLNPKKRKSEEILKGVKL